MNARPLAGKSTTKTPGYGEPGAPKSIAGWWFQMFFIFTPTWGNDPI